MKKISIILTTFNRAHLIIETLESVVAQSFTNWECIIIDDNSKDKTKQVILDFIKNDNRFEFFIKPKEIKQGLPASRNIGLTKAKGDYIIFFDDDDYIHPNNLEICLMVFKQKDVDFCHYNKKPYADGDFPIVENTVLKIEGSISKKNIEDVITNKIGLASCTVMWKSKCFKGNYFNENLMYAEEWECYSRIISKGFEGVYIANVLYYNRKHLNSNTGQFYLHDFVLRESKMKAIMLVLSNLKETKLLTKQLLNYFVDMSQSFKEFNLFEQILIEIEVKKRDRIYWRYKYIYISIKSTYQRFKRSVKEKYIKIHSE
jgi:glycosyltransferase involved in cell wall biosynthesis